MICFILFKNGIRILRISFIINSFGAGGKERQLLYLLEFLSKFCSIQLIVFNEKLAFWDRLQILPIKIVVFKKKERESIKTLLHANKALYDFNPEIIHAWDNIANCIVLPYILLRKVKVVNGSIRYAGKLKKNIIGKCLQSLAFSTSHVIVSNSRAGLAVENLLSNRKSRFIHNGFNSSFYSHETSNFRNKILNIVEQFKYSIVMVARFFPLKDYITFIQAAKMVVKDNPDVVFFCIGEGPNKSNATA